MAIVDHAPQNTDETFSESDSVLKADQRQYLLQLCVLHFGRGQEEGDGLLLRRRALGTEIGASAAVGQR